MAKPPSAIHVVILISRRSGSSGYDITTGATTDDDHGKRIIEVTPPFCDPAVQP